MTPSFRLALLTPSLRGGGLEKLVRDLALATAERGIHTGVFCLGGLGVYEEQITAAGVPVYDCRGGRFRIRGYPNRLIAQLRGFAPDLIHAHSGTWFSAAVARSVLRRPRLVYTDHGRYPPEPWRRAVLERWCAARTDGLVAVSQPLAEYVHRFLRLDEPPLVISNGIVLERYRDEGGAVRARMRSELGYGDDEVVVVILGRMAPVKNHRGLLEAFADAMREVPALRLAVVGTGALEGDLRALADRLGVGDAVRFLGFRTDVPACLLASDLFAMPSFTEGLPVALLEGMAAGLPVIASRVGGIPDALGSPAGGVLVPVGDGGALREALVALGGDPARREALGRTAARRAERFSFTRFIDRYVSLYSNTLKRTVL